MRLYMTESPEKLYPEKKEETFSFVPDDGTENQVVNLYPSVTYQTMEGFGGAITDAAGYVFSRMDKDQQEKLDVTAWKNPSGEIIGIFMNKSDERLPAVIRMEGRMCRIFLEPRAIASCIIR